MTKSFLIAWAALGLVAPTGYAANASITTTKSDIASPTSHPSKPPTPRNKPGKKTGRRPFWPGSRPATPTTHDALRKCCRAKNHGAPQGYGSASEYCRTRLHIDINSCQVRTATDTPPTQTSEEHKRDLSFST
mmetsp:Transcript_28261/g.59889  ORF Transcript_28261/g.59889 Transcript_28261/m.59889 type:complete len:133 (-) Transcript_28261:112-510(-)